MSCSTQTIEVLFHAHLDPTRKPRVLKEQSLEWLANEAMLMHIKRILAIEIRVYAPAFN